MKIIIAPDSFKSCLRSQEVVEALSYGLRQTLPDALIVAMPLADGGEGTVEALVLAAGGEYREVEACGPLGERVLAHYGLIDQHKTAIIEMAAASGIELVPVNQLNPLQATTWGTGELIADALNLGVTKIILGIGGSATCDGGAGMIQALGVRFRDRRGIEIAGPACGGMLDRIAAIELPPQLPPPGVEICVACDVTNPLLGANGCARVYGPQKGANAAMVAMLERNLSHWANILNKAGLSVSCEEPGDGAAGGLGFGLRTVMKAKMSSGAALVIDAAGLENHLADADLVITGEGCTDGQTLSGKLCSCVADTAAKYRVPTIVVSGALKGDRNALLQKFAAAFSITPGPCRLEDAIADARRNLSDTAAALGGMLAMRSRCANDR